tara:strand:- start:60 stop:287 length:228 start_codon:yes stop_codon:yes gene_type:complete
MSKKNIEIVRKIISQATGSNINKINYETNSDDLVRWDSLAQIKIVTLLEKNFKKNINTTKAASLQSVKEICKFPN